MKIKGIPFALSICIITQMLACREPATKEKLVHTTNQSEIQLQDGKKWKVDSAMLVHIRNMEQAILGNSGETRGSNRNLSAYLQTELNSLTSGCTMEGPAHDELHKWLLPFMELVERMSKDPKGDDATQYNALLKTSLEEFNTYFE